MLHRSDVPTEAGGFHTLIEGGTYHLEWLSLGLITLNASMPAITVQTGENEVGLVILDGRVSVMVGEHHFAGLGSRASVFAGPPTVVYVPIGTEYRVTLESERAHIAACQARAARWFVPFVVRPDEVTEDRRGDKNWRRVVRNVLVDNSEGRVDRLVLGETINEPGEWSSYPPHKHDEHRPPVEVDLEEVYYYKLDPPGGFGVQVHYGSAFADDTAHLVHDGDAFALPDGYHPVVAAGGYRLYYLWFMAGPSGRTLSPFEDPQHSWVKGQ